MKKEFVIMYCDSCKQHYRYDDQVVLDMMNGIFHADCYHNLTKLPIKDRGTYREIVEKYDFFFDLR